MPLHRDIHWIGRQWAVTGHGVQLIDQKLQGFFDIEAASLWDEVVIESIHAKEWLNVADFEKALAIARTRYPQSPGAVTPTPEVAAAPAIGPLAPRAPLPPVVKREEPKPETLTLVKSEPVKPAPAEPPSLPSLPTLFEMRYDCRARFVRPWRVLVKRSN
jgi:hypothetical protein